MPEFGPSKSPDRGDTVPLALNWVLVFIAVVSAAGSAFAAIALLGSHGWAAAISGVGVVSSLLALVAASRARLDWRLGLSETDRLIAALDEIVDGLEHARAAQRFHADAPDMRQADVRRWADELLAHAREELFALEAAGADGQAARLRASMRRLSWLVRDEEAPG